MSVRQDGSTALMLACGNGRLDVARWLVDEKGCDVNARRTVGSGLWVYVTSCVLVECSFYLSLHAVVVERS